MLCNNANARRFSYFELGLPVVHANSNVLQLFWTLYPFATWRRYCHVLSRPLPMYMCRPSHAVLYSPLGYVFFRTYRLVNILIPESWGFLPPGVTFHKCWFLSCYLLSATPLPPTELSVLPENTGGVRVQWGFGSVLYSPYNTVVIVKYHAEHKPNKVCKTFYVIFFCFLCLLF